MKLLNGCEIYGIDISRSVAEIATQFGSVVLTEASNLPFRDTIFSSVLMIEVIEHMKDKDSTKALKEAHRVLRKNGQLTIHTQPNGFLGRPFYFLNRRRLRETGRINTLTPWELKKRILRCNFSIEKFYMRDFLILRRLERSFFGNMLKQFLGNRMLAVTRRGVQKEHSKPVVGYF
jgi:ubiquinone/menaquinone biosynthesis C-methylase UbiE